VSVTRSQGDSVEKQANVPATLAQAHELLWQQRPAKDADALVWVEFHRHGAEVYSRVSAVDARHRHGALVCGGLEIRKAREIEHRRNPEVDDA